MKIYHLKAVVVIVLSFLLWQMGELKVSAGIPGSPHDMVAQGHLLVDEDDAEEYQCVICHLTPTDDRPLIWEYTPPSMESFGRVGKICASCHDGVSIVDRNVDAALTSFHPDSHGLNILAAPTDTDPSTFGLSRDQDTMDCTTCHDPHENKNRPFLKFPITGLCERCHQNRLNDGFGWNNFSGNHPVDMEPFDNTQGPSPIEIQPEFSKPFPASYPLVDGLMSEKSHWIVGGHLSFGEFGRVECFTCHTVHGEEGRGAFPGLLARDPVKVDSNEFCEGCHRGQRGDDKDQPPFPNPGETTVGRTYHPLDDDEANGLGWLTAIADTTDLQHYEWGHTDEETGLPYMLCTTCHRAHGGMENSPALVPISDEIKNEGVGTFCETCHREAPQDHHGYESDGQIRPEMAELILLNQENLGHTYGSPVSTRIYCSYCHVAHNAGFGRKEEEYIPILVDKGTAICESCHQLGVSHFLGDPVLPSTFGKDDPSMFRGTWPATGEESYYDGDGRDPTELTCLSCHYLGPRSEENYFDSYRLLAPAGDDSQWTPEFQEEYLCTGCHGEDPTTAGGGHSHPLMDADSNKFPDIITDHLLLDESPTTYTVENNMNCHSCHRAHNAVTRGGVYILKVIRGNNEDDRAIHPAIDYTALCHSCHPSERY